MSIESEAIAALTEILNIDDKTLLEEKEQFEELFLNEANFEEAKIQKITLCRANGLTVDDLLEENDLALASLPDIKKTLSEVKFDFLESLILQSVRLNNSIIQDGLHTKAKVRVEKLQDDLELPAYAHEEGDSGLDIKLIEDTIIPAKTAVIAPTGMKVAIPLGYEIQIRPRSGNSLKPEYMNLFVANSPGTIDANYRNEIGVILKNTGDEPIAIVKGTKIAQMVLTQVTQLSWVEVPDINRFPTKRTGGFGSTGEK